MARGSIFQGLSSRERGLLLGVGLLVLFGGTGLIWVLLDDAIAGVQEQIDLSTEAVEEIRVMSKDYLDSMKRKSALEATIQKNDERIQTLVEELAEKQETTTFKDNKPPALPSSVRDLISFEAKTSEKPIKLGKSKGDKGRVKDSETSYFEISKPVQYQTMKAIDLFKFIELIESPASLMYISKLKLDVNYHDSSHVSGKMTVTTFIYKKPEKDPEEESEGSGKE